MVLVRPVHWMNAIGIGGAGDLNIVWQGHSEALHRVRYSEILIRGSSGSRNGAKNRENVRAGFEQAKPRIILLEGLHSKACIAVAMFSSVGY